MALILSKFKSIDIDLFIRDILRTTKCFHKNRNSMNCKIYETTCSNYISGLITVYHIMKRSLINLLYMASSESNYAFTIFQLFVV